MRMAARLAAMGQVKYRGLTRNSGGRRVWSGGIRYDEATLDIPLRWKKPRLVFVNSMSDLFHADVPERFIRRVWGTMAATPQHVFQILTKRPERMRTLVQQFDVLPNVWLGTSIETSDYLWRLAELRATRASVRFASFEPLLGPVLGANLAGIHWAIVGGESGPGARPMDAAWVRSIHEQCVEQDVAFFFKQWGGTRKKQAGRTLDGRTWDEMPPTASTSSRPDRAAVTPQTGA